MSVAVEWSDGRITSGATWIDLMEKVRGMQWRDLTVEEFRLEMAKRALRWSRTEIDPWLTPRKFFQELQRAQMLIVVDDEEVGS